MKHRFLLALAIMIALAPVALFGQSDHPAGCT